MDFRATFLRIDILTAAVANLFFQEPHQLTKFILEYMQVHLNNIWQRAFHFKNLFAIFLDLQTKWPYSLTLSPIYFRFRVFLQACSLSKTKLVDPPPPPPIFFNISDLTNPPSYTVVKVSKKVLDNFHENILKIRGSEISYSQRAA